MIYNFSHYLTADGRRVQFVAARADVELAASLLGTSWFETNARAADGDEVVITATPADARRLVDALSRQGGEAAVAARMLTNSLEGMVYQLRASRSASPRVRPVTELRASA